MEKMMYRFEIRFDLLFLQYLNVNISLLLSKQLNISLEVNKTGANAFYNRIMKTYL